MQRFIVEGSKNFLALTPEEFLLRNSLEGDSLSSFEEIPVDPSSKCFLVEILNKDAIYEQYENIFFKEESFKEEFTDSTSNLRLVRDCNGCIYLTTNPMELLSTKNNNLKNSEGFDLDSPFLHSRQGCGRKSHHFKTRTEKFWRKELRKKTRREARKAKMNYKFVI